MVRVRDGYSAADLRRLAKVARTTAASRRLLSLALTLKVPSASQQPAKATPKNLAKDQRYKATYLFAAACPETNKSAALVLPMPIPKP